MYVWPCLLSLFLHDPVTEATGDNHPSRQLLDPGQIAGIIIAANAFILLFLVLCSLIICWLCVQRAHSKKTSVDGQSLLSDCVDLQSAYHQMTQSTVDTFDTTNHPATQPRSQGLPKSQESDRQRFLKRSVCRIGAQVYILHSAWFKYHWLGNLAVLCKCIHVYHIDWKML